MGIILRIPQELQAFGELCSNLDDSFDISFHLNVLDLWLTWNKWIFVQFHEIFVVTKNKLHINLIFVNEKFREIARLI